MEYFTKPTKLEISHRKLEGYLKLAKIIQWGRCNPIGFCERFFGIEFFDVQKWIFMNTWTRPYNLWCITRGGGKSTLAAPLIMAKGILISGHNSCILSNVSSQSQETFMKIEKIAKKEIPSFAGLTDFFLGELVTSTANKDGFTHAQSGFNYKLFNGSQVTSLSGEVDNNRGRRSNFNLYDESGWITEEYIAATKPFLILNNDMKIGGGVDTETLPKQIPNQRLFISSASSTDSQFYKYYKEYSMNMLLGDKKYFVADIDCDVMLHPKSNGIFKGALISKEDIQSDMKTNPEKAVREYYNKFETDGGDGQVFKRADIIRNSKPMLPVLSNVDRKKHRYVLAYDPARMYDNSPIIVAEIIKDEQKGEKLKICNCIELRDINLKKKTPLPIPEQIKKLKEAILDYNGKEFTDYENIETILIDSGAGGGGQSIPDFLWEDWTDKNGNSHRGLIDKEVNKDYVNRYPNAINKIRLISPKKYKTILFDSLYEMINQNLIIFPVEYNGQDYINIPVETGKNIVIEGNEDKEIKYKQIKLDNNQKIALKNIDLAKEEIVHIYRSDNSQHTEHTYALNKEVKNKMHDDKAYCLALLGWYLQEVRRSHITNKKVNVDYSNMPFFVSYITL